MGIETNYADGCAVATMVRRASFQQIVTTCQRLTLLATVDSHMETYTDCRDQLWNVYVFLGLIALLSNFWFLSKSMKD